MMSLKVEAWNWHIVTSTPITLTKVRHMAKLCINGTRKFTLPMQVYREGVIGSCIII